MLYYVKVDSIERYRLLYPMYMDARKYLRCTPRIHFLVRVYVFVVYIYIAPSSLSLHPVLECSTAFFYKGEKERDKNPKPYSKYVGFLNPNQKVFRAIFLPFFFPSFRGFFVSWFWAHKKRARCM